MPTIQEAANAMLKAAVTFSKDSRDPATMNVMGAAANLGESILNGGLYGVGPNEAVEVQVRLVVVPESVAAIVRDAVRAAYDKVSERRSNLVTHDDGTVEDNRRSNDLSGQMFDLHTVLDGLIGA